MFYVLFHLFFTQDIFLFHFLYFHVIWCLVKINLKKACLLHVFIFTLYRTVAPILRYVPNHDFCVPLHPYYVSKAIHLLDGCHNQVDFLICVSAYTESDSYTYIVFFSSVSDRSYFAYITNIKLT